MAHKAHKRRKVNPLENVVLKQVTKEFYELDANGMIYAQELGFGATKIVKSSDGITWTDIYDFGEIGKPTNIKALDNGEIVVAIAKNTTTNIPASVYLSSQNQTVFTKVLETANMGVELIPQFGISVNGENVIVNEYGVHGQATRVYLSRDRGLTFAQILNLAGHTGNLANTHVHGCFFDEYYNRIWVTWGDGGHASPGADGNYGIFYSDDFGATWVKTFAPKQCFGGYALEDRVVFLGDAVPNGLWAYERQGKDVPVTFKLVELFDKEQRIHYVPSGQAFRRGAGYPLLIPVCFANGDTTKTGTKFLLATTDGLHFDEIWRDTVDHANSMYFLAHGPLNNGKLFGQFKGDGRYWETEISANLSYSDVLTPVRVSDDIKNTDISARDLGVKGWEFSETHDLYSAIRFATANKKRLVLPKDMVLSLTKLQVKNINNIAIKFDCDINELTTITGIQHCMEFENCNNLNLEFNSNVSRTSNSSDSSFVRVINSQNVKIGGLLNSKSPEVSLQKGAAIELVNVTDYKMPVEVIGFEYGYKLGNNGKVDRGSINGEIKNCYRSPLWLFLIDNTIIKPAKLTNNGIVGNAPNVLGSATTILNNVVFDGIYFTKGNIGANILLETIGSASNTIFQNCDFSEFTGANIGTRIRKSAGITTRNNKGVNFETGLTSAPTYTHWSVGEEIELTPVAGGYRSLVCVTAGSQGAWKGVGLIEA